MYNYNENNYNTNNFKNDINYDKNINQYNDTLKNESTIFNYYGLIDIGKIPTISEDNMEGFTLLNDNILCMCIADGLGSVIGSQISSVVAIKEIKNFLNKFIITDDVEHIKYILNLAFYTVNKIIENYQRINPELFGFFTSTLTIVLINKKKEMVLGHIGNSRLYLLREGNIFQLTNDDTIANDLLKQGLIKDIEYKVHPDRNRLTKYLGQNNLEPYIDNGTVQKDDLILLCTNGLFEMLTDNQISEIIYATGNSKDACESLIYNANTLGGIDNIATIISFIDF